ncbi:TIGR03435 family protein [Terriglobus roseus]|uniref:Soil-associated protein, TIGR03435 family n=1 Tax=Terriglobus roseus TaxID=392734 RepID=A0A1G7F6V7_9BACT|nr:TIGR03435 family protein [Terriglobus roseus]SDE71609.1 soil-associated protein, TIGR03435 family [Terriglobus roseus]
MNRKARRYELISLTVCLLFLPIHAQRSTTALTFESASVKPAAPDAPMEGLGFMIALGRAQTPHGLLTMTGALPPLIMFAYGVNDEVEARAMRARLPEWAQHQKYTIVARPPEGSQNMEDIRLMLRNLLEDRFALKAHRENHTGMVNLLSVAKPGVTGPNLKPHETTPGCLKPGSPVQESVPSKPSPVLCGLQINRKEGGIMHVSMIDVTLPEACTLFDGLGGVLGGRGMDRMVDATGLTGHYDMTLDFQIDEANAPQTTSDGGGPTFTGALEKQLGLRLKKGTGQIEDLIVDHIAQTTPD